MKTSYVKALLIVGLTTFTLSGCYTQIALIEEPTVSYYEPLPPIPEPCPPFPPHVPTPIYVSPTGGTDTPVSSQPHRTSGNHRGGEQTTSREQQRESTSRTREEGSTRSPSVGGTTQHTSNESPTRQTTTQTGRR